MSKILLALSGGVDSSVAGALLGERGHDLVAAFLTHPALDPEPARQAARDLGIELVVEDISQPLERIVFPAFERAYASGHTPNPCVLCNPTVKFAALLSIADRLGCDQIATGHYARIETPTGFAQQNCAQFCMGTKEGVQRRQQGFAECVETPPLRGVHTWNNRPSLLKALSPNDQSYMLCRLTPDILARCVFPLGEFHSKEEVRAYAASHGISAASRPDSMEICFIPDGDYAAWLRARGVPDSPGDFVDADGNLLGHHRGILGYTVGMRRGLGVSADERLYVKHIDPTTNRITLVKENDMYTQKVELSDLRQVSVPFDRLPDRVTVKLRHSTREYPASLTVDPPFTDGASATLTIDKAVRIPAPGQFAAIYLGEVLAASGIIR